MIKVGISGEVVSINEDDQTDYDLVYHTDPKTGLKSLRGGTLEKFIVKLTAATLDEHDQEFVTTFLLTYRSFTKPVTLFNLLKNRFHCSSIKSRKELQPIRLRVFNFLKRWLSQYTYEFTENDDLMELLNDFIHKDMVEAKMPSSAKTLSDILQDEKTNTLSIPIPVLSQKPYLQGIRFLTLLHINPTDLAKQLTLYEHELYKKIKPWECFKAGWTKDNRDQLSPNISACISHFNKVGMWVATEVIRQQNIKQRTVIIQKMISLGKKLKGLKNYNGCMEIVAGLEQASLSRLKYSWGDIGNTAQKAFQDLSTLVKSSENYKNLREAFSGELPLIPYLGVFLADLVFLEQGNPDYLWAQEGFINFYKCDKIATVIKTLQHYQPTGYQYPKIPRLREYILNFNHLSEDELYEYSYQVLPLGKNIESDRSNGEQENLDELLNSRFGGPPQDSTNSPRTPRNSFGSPKFRSRGLSRFSRNLSLDGANLPLLLKKKYLSTSKSATDLSIPDTPAFGPRMDISFASSIDDSDDIILPRFSSAASISTSESNESTELSIIHDEI